MTAADATAPAAAALALVPGLEGGAAPLRLERLTGGSVNDSWRIDTARGRFVLRLDGPAALRPGVDRVREQRLHAAAAAAGIAPRVHVVAAAAGVQVCEFLEGRGWSAADLARPQQLARLGARLAQLHALAPPAAGVAGFDPGACAREYLRLIPGGSEGAGAAAAVAAEVQAAAREVADAAGGFSIVHGDLAHANLLEGAQLWLLDWEYAQLADPVYDLACVLAYYPQARPQAQRLIQAAGFTRPARAARLDAAVRVYQGLSRLWHQARGEPAAAD